MQTVQTTQQQSIQPSSTHENLFKNYLQTIQKILCKIEKYYYMIVCNT